MRIKLLRQRLDGFCAAGLFIFNLLALLVHATHDEANDEFGCKFVGRPNPEFPTCEGGVTWTHAQAHAHAWRHAPVLHFHPLEEWMLTDPRTYFK